MPMATLDPSIDLKTYEPNENEAVIFAPLYNVKSGLFRGLTRRLGLITVRGDEQERFFGYGYSKEKSKVLYCNMKTQLPNIFSSTCFKKHTQALLDQNENGIKQSLAFFFLPATLERKPSFNIRITYIYILLILIMIISKMSLELNHSILLYLKEEV